MLSLFSLGDKPNSLIKLALQRAVMCSKVSDHLKINSPDPFYTAGLFSMLDALLDHPLEELLAQVNIDPELVDGILNNGGIIGKVLNIVKKYQNGDVNFNDDALTEIFIESANETNEIMKAVGL